MKIVATAALTDNQREQISRAAGEIELLARLCRTPEEISETVRGGCDLLLTFRLPSDILQLAPGLRWVQLLSAGADHALASPLRDSRVMITTASGIHATPIAEYVLASMLAYAHRLHITLRAQMRREWTRSGRFMASVDELRGKTVGIVGYGSIGREVARLAEAFGMTVLALKRDPAERADQGWMPRGLGDPEGRIPREFYGAAQRREMLAQSDYIVVTLPLTAATRSFIGKQELGALKPGAYLVNVGRGEVIDQHELIGSLAAKRLGGAGLDVFEREPLESTSPLWDFEEVILTPHMSGSFRGYMDRACELFAENLRRFRNGEQLLNLVDQNLGY